jgi:ABC-type nitrate/sulfonate/bicarbonate transport system substrate-binding protein
VPGTRRTPAQQRWSRISRRGFIGGALSATAALAGVAGCGGATPHTPSDRPDPRRVALQLCGRKTARFAGSYLADSKGHYAHAGLAVELRGSDPGTSPEQAVVSGQALAAVAHIVPVVHAITNGAPLRIIGTQLKRYPYDVYCRLDKPLGNPILEPNFLIGKKIGLTDNAQLPFWQAMLIKNNIPAGSVNVVPAELDLAVLQSGKLDGLMGYGPELSGAIGSRGITSAAVGSLSPPIQLEDVYIVRSSSLTGPTRELVRALVEAEVRGWQDAVTSPEGADEAANLAVDKYGADLHLDRKAELVTSRDQFVAITDYSGDDITKRRLFWMDDFRIDNAVEWLNMVGVRARPGMFTNEVLLEIFQGRTWL